MYQDTSITKIYTLLKVNIPPLHSVHNSPGYYGVVVVVVVILILKNNRSVFYINYRKMTWTHKCNSAEAVCYVRHSILYKRVLSLSVLHASYNNLANFLNKDVDVFNRKTNSCIMNIKNNQEHLKFYKSLLFLTSYYYLSHYNYDRK